MKDKAVGLGKRLITHELVKGSSLIFLGSTFANICGFIFNLFLVRNLSYENYGEYTALLSLIVLVSIPGQSFMQIIVQFVSRYFAKNEKFHVKEFYFQSFRLFNITSITIFLLFFI
ncbi:MAG TPA: hypothetical protein VF189_04755, partial [Patescibacteria group bacterium]